MLQKAGFAFKQNQLFNEGLTGFFILLILKSGMQNIKIIMNKRSGSG